MLYTGSFKLQSTVVGFRLGLILHIKDMSYLIALQRGSKVALAAIRSKAVVWLLHIDCLTLTLKEFYFVLVLVLWLGSWYPF